MIGVMGIFDERDALLRAIDAAQAHELTIVTAFSPAYDDKIVAAAGARRSAVPAWTLAGAIIGAIAGLAFTIWTVRQWPVLIVGAKPLVSLPPFLIVAFELTILLAACAAVLAALVGGRATRRLARSAYEPSLSDAQFGLLLACPSAAAAQIGDLLVRCGAATWRVV
jgi:hypothetical protein